MGRSRLRALSWIVGVAGLLVIGGAALVISLEQAKSLNVLLITVDTLRPIIWGPMAMPRTPVRIWINLQGKAACSDRPMPTPRRRYRPSAA